MLTPHRAQIPQLDRIRVSSKSMLAAYVNTSNFESMLNHSKSTLEALFRKGFNRQHMKGCTQHFSVVTITLLTPTAHASTCTSASIELVHMIFDMRNCDARHRRLLQMNHSAKPQQYLLYLRTAVKFRSHHPGTHPHTKTLICKRRDPCPHGSCSQPSTSDVEPTRPRSFESVVHSSPIFLGRGMVT